VPGFEKTLQGKSNEHGVREFAARGLGQVGGKGSLPILAEALGDPEVQVRMEARNALQHIDKEGEASVPAIVAQLKDQKDLQRRFWIVYELATFTVPAGKAKEAFAPALETLREEMNGDQDNVEGGRIFWTAFALEQIGGSERTGLALVDMLKTDKAAVARRNAALAQVHRPGHRQEARRSLGGKITGDEQKPGKPVVVVDFHGAKVTDADFKELKGLKDLQSLGLWETKVTDAGLKELQEALPRCQITH
jgi:HEAT repeat protein